MNEIRCGSCRRKLAEGEYIRLTIKCPRCGAFNQLSAQSAFPERPRASTEGKERGKNH
ncbi:MULTISPECIES: Com family DNA-binding transcriptional regulator [Comamonas]|uniref:Com family DNA-binding transcriptional regulator n=1 Tax=Comamonas TaxID=283 RepID=UPI000B41D678|nr:MULTISPECIES: Com family DNA-binding transcriptional regulator [Comamonas]WEE79564.1 Com family DNA-binding transcriptional regulator [Comamonas testosteroni]